MSRIPLDPPPTLVYRLAEWYSRPRPRRRQVLAYAEAMSSTPLTVSDEMVADVQRELDDGSLVELTMMVSVENVRSRFNGALGLTSQGFKDRCEIPAPIR